MHDIYCEQTKFNVQSAPADKKSTTKHVTILYVCRSPSLASLFQHRVMIKGVAYGKLAYNEVFIRGQITGDYQLLLWLCPEAHSRSHLVNE